MASKYKLPNMEVIATFLWCYIIARLLTFVAILPFPMSDREIGKCRFLGESSYTLLCESYALQSTIATTPLTHLGLDYAYWL